MLNIILSVLLPQCPYSFSHLNNTGHFSILRCTYSIHVFLQLGQCPCGFWEPCSLLGDEWPHSVSLCLLGSNRGHWAASITSWENRGSCDRFASNEGQNSHHSNFRQKPLSFTQVAYYIYMIHTRIDINFGIFSLSKREPHIHIPSLALLAMPESLFWHPALMENCMSQNAPMAKGLKEA